MHILYSKLLSSQLNWNRLKPLQALDRQYVTYTPKPPAPPLLPLTPGIFLLAHSLLPTEASQKLLKHIPDSGLSASHGLTFEQLLGQEKLTHIPHHVLKSTLSESHSRY